jgi:hypothetical protein
MSQLRWLIVASTLNVFFLSAVSTTFLGEIQARAGVLTSPLPSHAITGTEGHPADQNIPSISPQSSLSPNSMDIIPIVPASPTFVRNCIPFGNNTSYGFAGFIYRDVPPFTLQPGLTFAFDLGAKNEVDIRRNIYFAAANKNPEPVTVSCDLDVTTQGIRALAWTKVVSDSQIPLNPRGNLVTGDYELTYTAEAPFSFPGGGLIVGFGSSPPGAYADSNCEQVLVRTDCNDASGHFYARFWGLSDQTLEVLDDPTGGLARSELGGIIIHATPPVNDFVTFEPRRATFHFTPDPTRCPEGFVGTFSFEARLTNSSERALSDLIVTVTNLTNNNLLQNADGGPGGVGAQLTVPRQDGFSDGFLSPDEFVDVPFSICLTQRQPFTFVVDVFGVVDANTDAQARAPFTNRRRAGVWAQPPE